MDAVVYYIIKMLICSGIFTGYYWIVLRNKRFHLWNRFYLLASVILSFTIPLLHIPLSDIVHNPQFYQITLSEKQWLEVSPQPVNWKIGFSIVSGLVSLFILIQWVYSLWRIRILKRKAVKVELPETSLYLTDSQSAPFSFFRQIFWRVDIYPESDEGQCILRHELEHVRARHTWDKLLMQIVLCVAWFNPFFWLIRYELDMIHEFTADHAGVGTDDTSVLAAMILRTVFPKSQYATVNYFFRSPVKRRLAMMSQNRSVKFAYFRRLMTLPLVLLLLAFLAIRVEASVAPVNSTSQIASFDLRYSNLINIEGYKNGQAAEHIFHLKGNPLFFVDGQKVSEDKFRLLQPAQIEQISVLKDKTAVELYGDDARYGVILVTMKK